MGYLLKARGHPLYTLEAALRFFLVRWPRLLMRTGKRKEVQSVPKDADSACNKFDLEGSSFLINFHLHRLVSLIFMYLMLQVLGLLWAFLLNAGCILMLDLATIAMDWDSWHQLALMSGLSTFYVTYCIFRVSIQFGNDIGLIAWQSLDDFPRAQHVVARAADRWPMLLILLFLPQSIAAFLLVVTPPVCEGEWGVSNAAGKVVCHFTPLKFLTQEFERPRSILTQMVFLGLVQFAQVLLHQFPSWSRNLSAVRYRYRHPLHAILVLLVFFTCPWLVRWVGLHAGYDWLRIGYLVDHQWYCRALLLGWTLWALYLAVLLCNSGKVTAPPLTDPQTLQEVFMNLKLSFLVGSCILFLRGCFHPKLGYLESQQEWTAITIVMPILYVTLYAVVKGIVRMTWALCFFGVTCSFFAALFVVMMSGIGGPGTLIIVWMHIYGKCVELLGQDDLGLFGEHDDDNLFGENVEHRKDRQSHPRKLGILKKQDITSWVEAHFFHRSNRSTPWKLPPEQSRTASNQNLVAPQVSDSTEHTQKPLNQNNLNPVERTQSSGKVKDPACAPDQVKPTDCSAYESWQMSYPEVDAEYRAAETCSAFNDIQIVLPLRSKSETDFHTLVQEEAKRGMEGRKDRAKSCSITNNPEKKKELAFSESPSMTRTNSALVSFSPAVREFNPRNFSQHRRTTAAQQNNWYFVSASNALEGNKKVELIRPIQRKNSYAALRVRSPSLDSYLQKVKGLEKYRDMFPASELEHPDIQRPLVSDLPKTSAFASETENGGDFTLLVYKIWVWLSIIVLIIYILVVGTFKVLALMQESRQWFPHLVQFEGPSMPKGPISFQHALVSSLTLFQDGPSQELLYPKYGLCGHTWEGLSLIDYALLSELAYFDPEAPHVNLPNILNTVFPHPDGWFSAAQPMFELRIPSEEYRRRGSAQFLEFYSSHLNVSVISIRGTDIGRISDLLEDIKVYTEPVVFMILSSIFPTVRMWSDTTTAYMVEWLQETQVLFGLRKKQEYYTQIAHYISTLQGRKIVLTGHSLGGGLARIAGALQRVPSISFSPPGLGQSFRKFQAALLKLEDIDSSQHKSVLHPDLFHETVSVVPENDPITKIDTQVGNIQYIMCKSSNLAIMNACHMLEGTICELISHCGDERKRFTGCHYEYNIGSLFTYFWGFVDDYLYLLVPGFGLLFIFAGLAVIPEI